MIKMGCEEFIKLSCTKGTYLTDEQFKHLFPSCLVVSRFEQSLRVEHKTMSSREKGTLHYFKKK